MNREGEDRRRRAREVWDIKKECTGTRGKDEYIDEGDSREGWEQRKEVGEYCGEDTDNTERKGRREGTARSGEHDGWVGGG